MIKKIKNIIRAQRDLLYATLEKNKQEIKSETDRLSAELAAQNEKLEALKYKLEDSLNVQKHLENKLRFCNPELSSLIPTDKRKVLVCGFYGAYNLGDELMLGKPLLTLLLETMPHYPNKMRYISEAYDNETDYILMSGSGKEDIVRELDSITSKKDFRDNKKAREEAKEEIRVMTRLAAGEMKDTPN